jgi:hypothetical protein
MTRASQARVLVAVIVAVVSALALAPVTASSADAAAGTDRLYRGEALYPGQRLVRTMQNGSRVELVMQTDGNLVLYNDGTTTHGKRVCWASNTQYNGAIAIYQYDGNFVVYTADGVPTWASHTQNDGGTTTNINAYGQLWAGYKRISSFCQ